MNGPYGWNQYPLDPLRCNAVVYEDKDTRRLCASKSNGVDGRYLGPSMDHYWCDLYLIPKTRAYKSWDQWNYFRSIASCRT